MLDPPTDIELPLANAAATGTSIEPFPTVAKMLLPLLVKPPAKVAVALTVLKVPPPLLVTMPVKTAGFWATVIVWPDSLVTGPFTVVTPPLTAR